ncbi:hypothetical protein [Thalassovita sp.]|jgi:hypothetical protein|uniref:hypothetical protein n=1 Tax=Thalassovita sp. TaxID=1979401 RepID=UPI003B5928CE
MGNKLTSTAVLLCGLIVAVPAGAGNLGALVQQGNSTFNKIEKGNAEWLEQERAADERRRKLAQERARQRAEEARRNGTYNSAAPEADAPSSSGSTSSKPSKSASSSGPSKGVRSITDGGRVSGTDKRASKIQCNNGRTHRIWRSSGQWWYGSGAQGGQNRNLQEQAEFLCD